MWQLHGEKLAPGTAGTPHSTRRIDQNTAMSSTLPPVPVSLLLPLPLPLNSTEISDG